MAAMLFGLVVLGMYLIVTKVAERFVPDEVWDKLFRVLDFD